MGWGFLFHGWHGLGLFIVLRAVNIQEPSPGSMNWCLPIIQELSNCGLVSVAMQEQSEMNYMYIRTEQVIKFEVFPEHTHYTYTKTLSLSRNGRTSVNSVESAESLISRTPRLAEMRWLLVKPAVQPYV